LKKAALILLAGAAFLSITACGSNPTAPDPKTLVGTWNATKAEFVSIANSSTKEDIVAGGSTVKLVLSASTFVFTITDPGQAGQVATGTWSASSDVMTLTWSTGFSGESQFDFSLSGDRLTMTGGHVPHDFTVGNFEEALLNLILARQ
jgi:Lipocalin-like domain